MSAIETVEVAHDVAGQGPAVLLLHGFPQCRAMWAEVTPVLARRFTVVTADLRGYGASPKPVAETAATYSFRAMAADMGALMDRLGFDRFHVVGHDRGGRVAHRLALDMPGRVESLAVLDILPTLWLLENWSLDLARAYWHWTWLAQPAPFPERTIALDPDLFFETCLAGWGRASPDDFGRIGVYRGCWHDPETVRGMTEDYRATPVADLADDRADRERAVACPALVMWGRDGVMARLFDVAAVWRPRLGRMRTAEVPGGHFFVDTAPRATAAALLDHLGR